MVLFSLFDLEPALIAGLGSVGWMTNRNVGFGLDPDNTSVRRVVPSRHVI
jgi:hypothetical protein